jgi:hypothetical protein
MIIAINEVATENATDDTTETDGHRGGQDGDGTKPMMLHNGHRWRLAASAISTGTRAPIVVVRMMSPRGGGGRALQ